MSDYPPEWKECLLGEVVGKISSGGTPKADNQDLYGGEIPFLRIDDITSSSKYLTSHKTTINERGLSESSAKIIPAGTLLLTMYGTIGRCCITTYPVATNQAIASFLEHPEIAVEYLYYALEHKAREFTAVSSQTTQANISASVLKQTRIAVPPLPEQKKIAEILSGIDKNLSSLHLYASKLRLARDEVITSFFHEASKSGEFREIRSFGEIATGSTPPTKNQLNYVGAIPFITPGDLSDSGGVIAGTKSSLSAAGATISRIIPPCSVCVVCIGSTIGKAALTKTESATNQQINTLVPGNYDPFFMLAAISHFRNEIRNAASTHAVPIINKRRFGEIAIPKPDLDQQRKFGDYISSSHNTLSHIMKKIQKYQQLKVAVASDLLSGRKRVTL